MIGTDADKVDRQEFRLLFNTLCDKDARLSAQELVFTLTVFRDLAKDTYKIDQLLDIKNIQGGIMYDIVAAQERLGNLSNIKTL